jgi:biuret amidohydrolase
MTDAFIEARPFDFPYDRRLDPASTALLVIDLQIDFLSPDGYFAKGGDDPAPLRAILPTVQRVIHAARASGCLIVYTRQGHRDDMADMTPYQLWRRKRARLEGTRVLLRSSPGHAIVPEIMVGKGSSRQGWESSGVQVPVPSIACVQAVSISGACGGNKAR